MKNQNITLDFSGENTLGGLVAGQSLALMPASLAKKLLAEYSKNLISISFEEIKRKHAEDIMSCPNHYALMCASIEFIQERMLIEACAHEQWGPFEINPEKSL